MTMLLFVEERPFVGSLSGFEEHFQFVLMDELLSLLYGSFGPLITIYAGKDGYRVHKVDTDPAEDIVYDLDDIRALSSLLEGDPMNVCIFTRNNLVFADDLKEIIEYHYKDGTGITALIKEGISKTGLSPVFIDTRMRLDYSDDSQVIRSRLIDVGYYIIDKDIMIKLLKGPSGIIGLEREMMISISDVEAIKGYRVRSKIGFLDDLESILETQRTVLDWMMQGIEKRSFDLKKNVNMMINMPTYIHNSVKIGENCRFGPYTTVMKGVKIGKNVLIINSILCENSVIGDDVYIEGSIIKPGSMVQIGSEIEWKIV